MTATMIGIVYTAANKVHRGFIVPDNDAELDNPWHVHLGEKLIKVSLASVTFPITLQFLKNQIALAEQVVPSAVPSGRCVVVDAQGNVAAVAMADPALDTHPAGTLMAHNSATFGWNWNGASWTKPYAVVDQNTLKVVQAAVMLDATNPVPPNVGQILIDNPNLKIGDPIPAKTVAVQAVLG